MFHPAPHFRRFRYIHCIHTRTVSVYIVSLAAHVGVGELMLVGDSGGSVRGSGVSQGEGASVEKPFVARDPTAAVYVIQLPWAPGVKTNHPLSTTTTPSVTNKRFVSPSFHSPTATADHFSGSLPPPGSTYLPAAYLYTCIYNTHILYIIYYSLYVLRIHISVRVLEK